MTWYSGFDQYVISSLISPGHKRREPVKYEMLAVANSMGNDTRCTDDTDRFGRFPDSSQSGHG